MQRRSLKAVLDAPFCTLNEIVEFELSFFKIKHFLRIKSLTFRGKLLKAGFSTVEGRLFQIQKN